MRWLYERTGLNWFEQRLLPARVMRGYRLRYRAGVAVSRSKEGHEKALARGW